MIVLRRLPLFLIIFNQFSKIFFKHDLRMATLNTWDAACSLKHLLIGCITGQLHANQNSQVERQFEVTCTPEIGTADHELSCLFQSSTNTVGGNKSKHVVLV